MIRDSLKKLAPFWISIIVGILLLVFAALQASESSPNPRWAMALFPFPNLVAVIWEYFVPGDESTIGFSVMGNLALLQYPVYGLFLSFSRNRWNTAARLFGFHVLAIALGVTADLFFLR